MAELIDIVMDHLTETVGLTVEVIAKRVGIERGSVYSTRRSVKKIKREEFAKKLIQAFPEYFPDGAPQISEEQEPEKQPVDMQRKYILLLEKSNEDLREEKLKLITEVTVLRDKLQAENEQIIAELKKAIEDIKSNFIS